jgi:hypothetical protein
MIIAECAYIDVACIYLYVPYIYRLLPVSVDAEEIKRLGSALTALSNEKAKQSKVRLQCVC